MKRYVTTLLLLSVIPTAYGGASGVSASPDADATSDDSARSSAQTSDEKYTIGVSYEGPTNDWASSLLYHLQYSFDIKYADQVEEVIYESADGDATQQVSQIENLLTRDLDALIIQPLSETALATVLEDASDAGVPVIVFGSSVQSEDYVTYVDRDNYGAGQTIATWVCDAMGGEGQVVTIMGEPGSGYSEDVLRGVSDALEECPGIENVGTDYGEYSPAVTKQIMETYLSANPDIGGVIVDGGLMGLGVLEAYTDRGIDYPYMTVDDWNGFQRAAQDVGYTDYISIPGGSEAAAVAVDLLFEHLAGEDVPTESLIEVEIMSGEEVQALIPEGMPDSYWALSRIPLEYVEQYYGQGG